MQRWTKVFLILPLLVIGPATGAHADAITAGTTVTAGSCIPFGCSPGSVYQQVYSSALFPGAFAISQLDFFNTVKHSGGDQFVDPAFYEVWISTTNATIGGLSTTNVDSNRGRDATRVFAGALGGSLSGEVPPGPDSKLTFTWSTPFHYDPASGNLLIDIRKTGGFFFGDDGTFLDFDGSAGAPMSLVSNFEGASGLNNMRGGLVTRFNGELTPAVTPEPGTLMLLGTGCLAFMRTAQRRRRAR